jgi:hypothetical protein
MGKYTASDKLTRVQIDDSAWVDIKSEMSYGDYQALVASYVNVQAKITGAGGVPEGMKLKLDLGNITLLLLNIKDWNLTDDSGKPLPVNEATIRSLKTEVAKQIIDEINRLNPNPKA